MTQDGKDLRDFYKSRAADVEVSQRYALPQHSCKPLCPACSYLIASN